MPHRIIPGQHPQLMLMEYYGELELEDMAVDDQLHLNEGRPIYLLLDATKMDVSLPDGFLDGAKNSFFVNENLAHMALCLNSGLLRSVALMVAKVTHRREKMSLHSSREAGLAHLEALLKALPEQR